MAFCTTLQMLAELKNATILFGSTSLCPRMRDHLAGVGCRNYFSAASVNDIAER
jgi:hypothetical protein